MGDQRPDRSTAVGIAILLRRAQLRKQLACETRLAELRLTLPQWGILHAVATAPDSSTHALALMTGQSDQAAGAVVARLEQRGLVERRPGVGKAIIHRITQDGARLVDSADNAVADVMELALSGLDSSEVHALNRYLTHVAGTDGESRD
ncbi:hypothetical protein GCM10018793_69410 [Streptomyces sulfonofaciens]|uniref:HTH marR-type domain-containing protein n=1 Tax=Streptomyces sulfonofaciens TaxID=68272 RepID=A0A919L8E6_9ACTN|nr:MarR family winged helix-turn-helix transcriptional regulator [Streptomyces sulfonofaciens]GHH88720.1 hypothetical protein GCM10018793_69410 [Streptomyces sulfonofaciens]